jgi:hypothetical protein
VKTLAHELAHADGGPEARCAGVREVEAESVAHLVLAAHGVDSTTYTFAYVASWALPVAAEQDVPLAEVVARTEKRVLRAANEVLAATSPGVAAAGAADALAPVAVRIAAATAPDLVLRDAADAFALTPIVLGVRQGVVADSHTFFQRQVGASWVPGYLAVVGLADDVWSRELGYAPAGPAALDRPSAVARLLGPLYRGSRDGDQQQRS